jgi:preprotein translocase subunit YajC
MAIRPQKKREQEAKDMQNSLQVGDEIITSGGIVGMIFRIGDDTVVIETGGERHKLRIKKWAIAENVTAMERAKEAQAAAKSKLASAGVTADEDDKKKSKKNKKSEDTEE